ncbi:MAG: exo-alpha-sialidase [Chitinophagales bacterium]|nr:exo-alpha-sialidase [Chitinophagales bacterium]
MKTLLLLISLISAIFVFGQETNVGVSNGFVFDGEPDMTVNPNDPNHIVVAWMGYSLSAQRISIKSKVSTDGGRNWSNTYEFPHFYNYNSADPTFAWDKNGTLYFIYIDFKSNSDTGTIHLFASTDGGYNWLDKGEVWNASEDPVKVPLDRPWLAIDNSNGPRQGTLYLTTKPAPWILPPNRAYLKISTDGGDNWSQYKYLDTSGALIGNLIKQPMAYPLVLSNGALCITYPSYEISQNIVPQVFLAKSLDGGAVFDYYSIWAANPGVQDTNYKLGNRLVAHPTDSNKLVFVTANGTNGDMDILLLHSEDGGITWNGPVRVNDDPLGNGVAQDLVYATYQPDGKLAVTWRDRRNGSGTGFQQPVSIYGAISEDNGATFDTNFVISDTVVAFSQILYESGNDFHASSLFNDTLRSIWGDTRDGKMNIYFARTPILTTDTSITDISVVVSEALSPLLVYPNPAEAYVNIKVETPGTLSIIDNQGKTVYQQQVKVSTYRLEISNWQKGNYFITLQYGKQTYTQQLLVK